MLEVLTRPNARSYITLPGYRAGMKPANYGQTYPPEVLTPGEITRLLAACSRRSTNGLRNRALIVIMWRTGLRVAEALALYPKDIDLDAGTVTVLHGKGDRRRVVGMDAQAGAVVEAWLTRRRELGFGPRQVVFCTYSGPAKGKPVYSSCVRETLKDLARKAGIDKRVHPHGLRHTHAFELVGEGIPLTIVRRQLGHSNLAVTARYVEHLNPREVVEAIRAREWPTTHPGPPPV